VCQVHRVVTITAAASPRDGDRSIAPARQPSGEKVLVHEIMKAENVVKLSKEEPAESELTFVPWSSTFTRRSKSSGPC